MRRLRLQCTILIILACLSIISVGFASWVTTTESTISSINGSIQVDDIIESNEYITQVLPQPLKFYKTGFVTKDGAISQIGSMSVELTIDINKCKETFSSSPNLNLYLTTTYSDSSFNIFKNDSNLAVAISLEQQDIEIKTNDISLNKCITQIKINDLTVNQKIVKIIFTFTNNNNTFNTIYNSLKSNTFKFNAKITGGE